MKTIPNIHPGEILQEDFLEPLGLSAYRLAKETGLSPTRIGQIIHGKRSITAETALRLSKFFGNSAEFWLGLQIEHDLRQERKVHRKDLARIRPFLRKTG